MFIFLSKLLPPLFYPLGMAASLWAVAAVLAWRRRSRLALRCAGAGVAVILVFSNGFVADALMRSLENDTPPQPVTAYPVVDAIVVLGGVTMPRLPPRLTVEVNDGFDRVLHGIRLWRAGKARHIVLAGGGITYLTGTEVPEAEAMASLVRESGVPPEALVLETRSRNTHENALYTAQILRRRGWRSALLVTSAGHMPRALGVFRKQGVEVIPAPTDFRVTERPLTPMKFLPDVDALRASTWAMKEFVGTVVYGLRGYL